MSARSTAAAVRAGERSARSIVEEHLAVIDSHEGEIHDFNLVLADEALPRADDLDRRLRAGEDPGPLAGVAVAPQARTRGGAGKRGAPPWARFP